MARTGKSSPGKGLTIGSRTPSFIEALKIFNTNFPARDKPALQQVTLRDKVITEYTRLRNGEPYHAESLLEAMYTVQPDLRPRPSATEAGEQEYEAIMEGEEIWHQMKNGTAT